MTHANHLDTMANAVLNDLIDNKMLRRADYRRVSAYRFPFAGGDYRVYRVLQRTWAVDRVDPETGRSTLITSDHNTRKCAIIAMARILYRTKCPHGYVILQDSCPGCDAYDESYYD